MMHASLMGSPSTFMEVECLIDTMLHELVHNEIGPHSDKFYDMLEEVRSLLAVLKFSAPCQIVSVLRNWTRWLIELRCLCMPIECTYSCARSATR